MTGLAVVGQKKLDREALRKGAGGLGRIPHYDLRSLQYPARALITAEEFRDPRSYTWAVGIHLDQGQEGACVGFGFAHEGAAKPKPVQGLTNSYAHGAYKEAQHIDEWPGENYDGTSVLAGAKVYQRRGFFMEYRWAMDIRDIIAVVGYKGPVVAGVWWYTGMDSVDAKGFCKPDGYIRGGHCLLINSVRIVRDSDGRVNNLKSYVGFWNSWGPRWGADGRCFMYLADFAKLVPGGEFCVVNERRLPTLQAA